MRRAAILLAVLALPLAAGCGAPEETDAAVWKARGDEAFDAGDWGAAMAFYRSAFRLEDPVPARRQHRAFLAHAVGRSLVRFAIGSADDDLRMRAADDALFWLDIADDLDADSPWPLLERALLFDRAGPGVRDRKRALELYTLFVGWASAAPVEAGSGSAPSDENAWASARARIDELQAIVDDD